MLEIERKWILKSIPEEVKNQTPILYERYFIKSTPDYELRVQKKGDKYELEEKLTRSDLTRKSIKRELTSEQFAEYKKQSYASLIRESYIIKSNPDISIKVYKDRFEGLIRAEVEFELEDQAKNFNPPVWFGKEITNSVLGKDKKLVELMPDKFIKILNQNLE